MEYPFIPGLTSKWLRESEVVAFDQLMEKWSVGPNDIARWVKILRQSWLKKLNETNDYCPYHVYRILEKRLHTDSSPIIEVSLSLGATADHAEPKDFVVFKFVEAELERVRPEWRLKKATNGAPRLVVPHVPLTPGQDFMGNPKPKRLERPTSLYDLLCKMEQAEPENRHILSLDITGEFRAGRLNIYAPPQGGCRLRRSPLAQSRATEIETLFTVAHYGGWTDVAALSALFVDMAEVEANETLNNALKHLASDTSGQEPPEVAPMVGEKVEGSQRALPTVSIVQRLKDGGETNKQIAARYPEFFGFNEDPWDRVYGRIKTFMKGKYKGNRR